jgi:hypothetical protein
MPPYLCGWASPKPSPLKERLGFAGALFFYHTVNGKAPCSSYGEDVNFNCIPDLKHT